MSPLRIDEIQFKAGTRCKIPRILLIVGPNGSGKTQALHEIQRLLQEGKHGTSQCLVVEELTIHGPQTRDEAMCLISPITYRQAELNEYLVYACDSTGSVRQVRVSMDVYQDGVGDKVHTNLAFRRTLVEPLVVFPRLSNIEGFLTDKKLTGVGSGNCPENFHQLLMCEPGRRKKISAQLRKLFGRNLSIQLVSENQGRFVISKEEQPFDLIALNPTKEMEQYYANCQGIGDFGDGFRVFVGLASIIFGGDHKILLLDEPELYLHAPLVRRLAHELIREFDERDGTIVASTHSADFVAGCLEATNDVAIVRLTYSEHDRSGKANVIEPDILKRFIQNPVLRNLEALPGLFYEAVVVVEGPNDKVAYSEFNRQLVQQNKGMTDVLFVAATGKTGVIPIGEPFAKSGVPTALVYDFDVFLEPKVPKYIEKYVGEMHLAAIAQIDLGKELSECITLLKGYARADVKLSGVRALKQEDSRKVKAVINSLASIGIFIAPVGELESWFAMLGFSDQGDKNERLFEAMDKLSDVGIPHHLNDPTESVWAFVHQISDWISRKSHPIAFASTNSTTP